MKAYPFPHILNFSKEEFILDEREQEIRERAEKKNVVI